MRDLSFSRAAEDVGPYHSRAAGRVIRTPEDKGVVLLLDDRFAKPEYQRLFPPHWRHLQYLLGPAALETALAAFWGSRPE